MLTGKKKKKKGKTSAPSMLVLKKKVVNKLVFMLRSARGIVWKARHLWMRTRKYSYKKAWVCGEIYCIMHNHTENTFGYCAALISIIENETFLTYAKYYHKYSGTFGLQWYEGTQTKRTGMDEKWGMPVSMLESDYCQASEDLLHGLFSSFLRAQYQRGITEILEPTS